MAPHPNKVCSPVTSLSVIEVFAGNEDEDGAQVTLLLNGERLAISIFRAEETQHGVTSPNASDILNRVIRLLCQSLFTDDYELQSKLEDAALEPILSAYETVRSESGTKEKSKSALKSDELIPGKETREETRDLTGGTPQNLHQVLYPITTHWRLEAGGATCTLVRIPATESYGRSYTDLEDEPSLQSQHSENVICDSYQYNLAAIIDDSIPRHATTIIEVVDQIVQGGTLVCQVRLNDQDMLCKVKADGLNDPNIEREIATLTRLRCVTFTEFEASVPRILGYVVHPASGVILGFLREWVESKASLAELAGSGFEDVSMDSRTQWAGQISSALQHLHREGIVWGDAKAGNVLISTDGHASLIDFGGGWSEGWVNESLQETIEGDKQGTERICRLLLGAER